MTKDYSGQNLRGRSFKGENLEAANFSGADIRSADFTGANLKGAFFSYAKAGLQRRWTTLLGLALLLLSAILGFISPVIGGAIQGLLGKESNIIFGVIILIVETVLLIIAIFKGLESAPRVVVAITGVAVAGSVVLAIVLAAVVAFKGKLRGVEALLGAIMTTMTFSVTIAAQMIMLLIFACVTVVTLTAILSMAAAMIVAVTLTVLEELILTLAVVIVIAVSVAFSLGGVLAAIQAGVVALLTGYVAWRALANDEKHAFVRSVAITFAATGGTSFRNADLTDADFTEATLKSTDFRNTNANLTRTRWRNAKKLDRIRPGTTYLQNEQVRQLVITGEGKNKNFERLDLRGLNLREANLENASFIDTDLYKADLSNANLSGTKLVRTNLERANLSYACLTGSCIQDWTISKGTKLDGIICDYVYLKWDDVKKDKRDQMPPRGKFKEGGFVTFVKYILDTVELYHEKDINPRLALSVLQKMAMDYDEPLHIVALGKRGDKVFVQVKVSESIIRENFKDDYYSRYDSTLKLWSGNIHQLPPAVNSFIEKRINEIASEKTDDFVFIDVTHVEGNYTPTYQGDVTMTGDRTINLGNGNYNERIEGDYTQGDKVNSMTNNPGGFSVGGSVGGNVNNVQGDKNRTIQGDNSQGVLGDNNQVTQQNQVGGDTSLTKDDVVKLLAELEALVKAAELPAETKEEVIEDLSSAKKATDKEEPNKNRALERLGSVAETLDKTSKSVESGQKIWTTAKPIVVKIATWLGAAAGSHLLGL